MPDSEDDVFVGEGKASYSIGSVGILDIGEADFRPVADECLFDSIFCAVDTFGSGYVRVSSLLSMIGDSDYGAEYSVRSGTVDMLRASLDPSGDDPYIDKTAFQSKASHWLSSQRPVEFYESTVRRKALPFDDEDLDGTIFLHSTPTPSPAKKGRVGDDDLSVFSCGSLEGTGGDVVRRSEADLLHEVTDLQFRNRRLQEETAQLKRQLVQAEDANVAAQNSYAELQKRANMLQSNLERCKFLETEYSALRQSLSQAEEQLVVANDKKKCLQKDIRLLTIEIQQAEAKIQEMESEIAACQNENEDLTAFLMREQSEVSSMRQQLEEMEALFNFEREQKNEARQSLDEVTRLLQIVQAEKSDLEAQLSRLLEEHPSLRTAASNTSFFLESEMALRRFAPMTSTPFRWNDCNETLHEELKRLGVDSESEGPWSLPIFSREEDYDPPPAPSYQEHSPENSVAPQQEFDLVASSNPVKGSSFEPIGDISRKEELAAEPKNLCETYLISDSRPETTDSESHLDLTNSDLPPPDLNKTASLPNPRTIAIRAPVRSKSVDNLVEEKKTGLLTKSAKLKKLREKQEKQWKEEKEKWEKTKKPSFRLEGSTENLLGLTMSTSLLQVRRRPPSSPQKLRPQSLHLPDIIHSSQRDLIEFSAIEPQKAPLVCAASPVCDTKRRPIKVFVWIFLLFVVLFSLLQISLSGRHREKCFQPVFVWYPVWEMIDSHLTYSYSGLPPQ